MKKSIVGWNNLAPGGVVTVTGGNSGSTSGVGGSVTIVGGIGNITMSICPICEKSYYGSAFDHALEFEDDLHKAMCVIG
jgi:hypothetical protein